jgi:metal-responsive CopG/Arc/MetJ family transcriptional regulator
MLRPKRNDKPVLLNLPSRVLEEVDMAVQEQGVTRSQFLRQAIERNLRHYQRVERAIFRSHLSARYELGHANETAEPCTIQCPLIA